MQDEKNRSMNMQDGQPSIYKLKIALPSSKFFAEPTAFIIAVDKSGSMAGHAMEQVKTALHHIMSMTYLNPLIKTYIITYDWNAMLLNLSMNSCDSAANDRIIDDIRAVGGTVFESAFDRIVLVIESLSDTIKNVQIAFLTDGEDNNIKRDDQKSKTNLLERFKSKFQTVAIQSKSVTLHAVGFGGGCDREFLEGIKNIGKNPGIFRYAEPADIGDTLCGKLTGLFEFITKSSSVPMNISITGGFLMSGVIDRYSTMKVVNFPIDRNGRGEYSDFVIVSDEKNINVTIDAQQSDIKDHVTYSPTIIENEDLDLRDQSRDEYLSIYIDMISKELLELSERKNCELLDLRLGFIEQKLNKLCSELSSNTLKSNLEFLELQVDKIRGMSLASSQDIVRMQSQLSDMAYTSKMSNYAGIANVNRPPTIANLNRQYADLSDESKTIIFLENDVCYSRTQAYCNENKCNKLQTLILLSGVRPSEDLEEYLSKIGPINIDEIYYRDAKDNNALHYAAYCGYFDVVSNLIELCKYEAKGFGNSYYDEDVKNSISIYVNIKNIDGETPLSLAVKGRGFDKTIHILFANGAVMEHFKSLRNFAIKKGYIRTSNLLTSFSDDKLEVTDEMTDDHIRSVIKIAETRALNNKVDFDSIMDPVRAFKVMSNKLMVEDVEHFMVKHQIGYGANYFANFALPKKPDAVNVDRYVQFANVFLKYHPEIVFREVKSDGRTHLNIGCGHSILSRSIESGNKPLVDLIINYAKSYYNAGKRFEHKISYEFKNRKDLEYQDKPPNNFSEWLDSTNELGNTALHIACFRCYPCLIEVLIEEGANVNARNLKGNTPLIFTCQVGKAKVAEYLINHGAEVNYFNSNNDTPILIACRNGQSDVLEVLLQHATNKFINHVAHIDGFNAVFASVESNKPNCIKVLADAGVSFKVKTDEKNNILPLATPLHLAAYYGGQESVELLLSLMKTGGSSNFYDINEPGQEGMTALHVAIVQNRINVVRLLIDAGADLYKNDNNGINPLAYCRDPTIKKLIVNPAHDGLLALSIGEVECNDYDQLFDKCGIEGFLTKRDCLDIVFDDLSTPLMQAIIHNRSKLAIALHKHTCQLQKPNKFGTTPEFWIVYTKNVRLAELLGLDYGWLESKYSGKLAPFEQYRSVEKNILFLGKKPDNVYCETESSLNSRMNTIMLPEVFGNGSENRQNFGESVQPAKLIEHFRSSESKTKLLGFPDKSHELKLSEKPMFDENTLLWNAKIFIVNYLASNPVVKLKPSELLSLYSFTSIKQLSLAMMVRLLNVGLKNENSRNDKNFENENSRNDKNFENENSRNDNWMIFVQYLYTTLKALPPYVGETFIGVDAIDVNDRLTQISGTDTTIKFRNTIYNAYVTGDTLKSNTFIAGTSLWKIAIDNIHNYSNRRKGTVILIKSKYGRLINSYSKFNDYEVVFSPGSKFKVTGFYMGSVIALGQENIRARSYGVKPEELVGMINSNASLIIELTEVDH